MAMLATKTRYTFADLLDQDPEDETGYEIFGGELVVYSSPSEPHAAVVMELVLFLGEVQRAGYGWVRTAPRAVAFDFSERGLRSEDVTQPDILFVREARRAILGDRCVEAAPDLLIEVLCPSTRELDLPMGKKWEIYERYGVQFYWIVDITVRTITQYSWQAGGYGEPLVLRAGDVVSCALFPDVTRTVDQIFEGLL